MEKIVMNIAQTTAVWLDPWCKSEQLLNITAWMRTVETCENRNW